MMDGGKVAAEAVGAAARGDYLYLLGLILIVAVAGVAYLVRRNVATMDRIPDAIRDAVKSQAEAATAQTQAIIDAHREEVAWLRDQAGRRCERH